MHKTSPGGSSLSILSCFAGHDFIGSVFGNLGHSPYSYYYFSDSTFPSVENLTSDPSIISFVLMFL